VTRPSPRLCRSKPWGVWVHSPMGGGIGGIDWIPLGWGGLFSRCVRGEILDTSVEIVAVQDANTPQFVVDEWDAPYKLGVAYDGDGSRVGETHSSVTNIEAPFSQMRGTRAHRLHRCICKEPMEIGCEWLRRTRPPLSMAAMTRQAKKRRTSAGLADGSSVKTGLPPHGDSRSNLQTCSRSRWNSIRPGYEQATPPKRMMAPIHVPGKPLRRACL